MRTAISALFTLAVMTGAPQRKIMLARAALTLLTVTLLNISARASDPFQYTFSLAGGQITGATVDQDGNVYFGGTTPMPLPTTPGVYWRAFNACAPVPATRNNFGRRGCSWAFVGKLSPAGALVWLTYLPEPNGSSSILQIAIDSAKDVYLAGNFQTLDNLPPLFPVTPGAFQTKPQGPNGMFLAKLNGSGSTLEYATFLNGIAGVTSLASDRNRNLYVAAKAAVAQLPLVNPLPGMQPGTGYLAKLNAAGSALLLATWINGFDAQSEIGRLTLDASGNLYVTGGCSNSLAPCVPTTADAYQRTMNSPAAGYAVKLSPDGALMYATLLPATRLGIAVDVAVDAAGNLAFASVATGSGRSQPFDLPVTPGAFQTQIVKRNHSTPTTGYVAMLDASGSTLLWATYFGGSSYDGITGLKLDPHGNLVFSGYSSSPDLPVTRDAWQPCHPAPDFQDANGPEADFLATLSADGRSLTYSTFIGPGIQPNGNLGFGLRLIGVDASGDVYLAGARYGFPALVRYRNITRPRGSAACVVNLTHGYGSAIAPLGMIGIRGPDVAGGRSWMPGSVANGLPLEYQGLQVFVGHAPAALLHISPDQIDVVAPDGPSEGTVGISVVQSGVVTTEIEAPAQSTAPGIITTDGSGFGGAAALNEDGSVNGPNNPAAPGSVVSIFLAGLGAITPLVQAGQICVAGGLLADVNVTLYRTQADVLYAGCAPGLLAGVYQVNFRVPETPLQDSVPLGITAAGQPTQSQPGNAQVGIYVSCKPGAKCVVWL